ncbi:antibiotic biosynthesis monooxygenase [Streptomyces sp. NPDC005805]|uniref:antibiotic biosynthesis monooxygenase n=1 Tax=Streptomyces sp. NPDC005805 TaxID=3157068 RepID=UPI0034083463
MSAATGHGGAPAAGAARVVFLIRVPADRQRDFLDAYEEIRFQVARGVPGHLRDQVCRSATDPEQWLITSEWRDLADFETWERSPEHRDLVKPMRDCFTEARSLRFRIHTTTDGGTAMSPTGSTTEGLAPTGATTGGPVRGELTGMLTAVGLDPELGEAVYATTFEALGLDSLARVELASRIKSRYGIDIEEEITAGSTPAEVEGLIGTHLSATV